jgi:hypothetical protein
MPVSLLVHQFTAIYSSILSIHQGIRVEELGAEVREKGDKRPDWQDLVKRRWKGIF